MRSAVTHLPHLLAGECAGEWQLHGRRGTGLWRCDVCGQTHPSTAETDQAADLEFARGTQLRSQTRQGRFRRAPRQAPPHIELPDPDDGVH